MFVIKIKTVNNTYLKRVPLTLRRHTLAPFTYTIVPTTTGAGWVKRQSAERFLAEVRAYYAERWALNGETPFDFDAIYEIVELKNTAKTLGS